MFSKIKKLRLILPWHKQIDSSALDLGYARYLLKLGVKPDKILPKINIKISEL